MKACSHLYNLADVRDAARRQLPRGIFEFIDRGAEDEQALEGNVAALRRLKLAPRTMVDVSARTTSQVLFGREQRMPVAIAPTGAAGLVWYNGEIALARAAAAAGIPFTLATRSMTSMEDIAKQSTGTLWFQLYLWGERALSYELVDRAAAAGYHALIVTVDVPAAPNREYNQRNGFSLPFGPSLQNLPDLVGHPGWLTGVMARYLMTTGMPRYENTAQRAKITQNDSATPSMRSDNLTWDDLSRLRDRWPGTLMIKGILRPDDAAQAVARGADAVVVSNHGGRALDAAVAPIDALPGVVGAVGGRALVLMDGAVRRGGDIVKALALGASSVLIGRPTLFGAAVAGEAGTAHVLSILQRELSAVMAMTGCRTLAEIDRDLIHDPERALSTKVLEMQASIPLRAVNAKTTETRSASRPRAHSVRSKS